AARGERLAHAAPSLARPGTGRMAGQRGARAHRLLRGSRQHRRSVGFPKTGHAALGPVASAPQPASPPDLGADGPTRSTVAPCRPDHASLAERPVRRQDPRQEPSAVVPLAGICAGGRPQGRSLPRMIDLDVQKFFDTVPWDLMVRAVQANVTHEQRWTVLYVRRWP